jgi:hypothetical protein
MPAPNLPSRGWGRTAYIGVEFLRKVPPRCDRFYPKPCSNSTVEPTLGGRVGSGQGRRVGRVTGLRRKASSLPMAGPGDASATGPPQACHQCDAASAPRHIEWLP